MEKKEQNNPPALHLNDFLKSVLGLGNEEERPASEETGKQDYAV